jgi:hypothetical protein
MEWSFENRMFAGEGKIGILHLRGFLGDGGLRRVAGAVDWALSRSQGPLVMDLTLMSGLNEAGRAAIWQAAHRVAAQQREVVLCGMAELGTDPGPGEELLGAAVIVHADLTTALAAVSA